MSNLNQSYFQNEEEAIKFLEYMRWEGGKPVCRHCGNRKNIYVMKGRTTRPGLYKCSECRKPFTAKMGTILEDSHIPVKVWLQAIYLLSSSKKGISSHQLHRLLNITYKSAWFLSHRIREAMKDPVFYSQLGGKNTVVEVDETFWGNKGKHRKGARGWGHKEKIFSLVERDGNVRSFHVKRVNAATLKPIMQEQIHKDTAIMTDDFRAYSKIKKSFRKHGVINHSAGEYVRGKISTNTVEGYFSILKRGLTGVYQHVGAKHLKKYIGEFDFRYNTRKISDIERTERALRGVVGKRLLYREPIQAAD